jgi:GNAT superfamily N-acetyltransferase
MKIAYKTSKTFTKEQIIDLFAFTGWTSAKFPNRLTRAINGSGTVVSAWNGDELIGLVSAIDDSAISMFITFTLVKPKYQSQGVGKELMRRLLTHYVGYGRKVLTTNIATNGEFYGKFGFAVKEDKREEAMFFTDWPESDLE